MGFHTKIKEKDIIDKVFNKAVGQMLPASFLELYEIYNNNQNISIREYNK